MSNKLEVQKSLDKYGSEILRALPASMQTDKKLERIKRIAMSELNKTPQLQRCDAISLLGALTHIAAFGLEPGAGFGHAYLVPYGNKCEVIIGYRGYIELARRSGEIKAIHSRIVYENDFFEIEYGSAERLVHRPNLKDPGAMVGVYAIAWLTNDRVMFEYMTTDQVDKIKDDVKNQHVWSKHYDEMARKTAVRRLYKYLPNSVEMADAAALEDTEPGDQKNWEIIDASYTVPEPERDPDVIKNLHEEAAKESLDTKTKEAQDKFVSFCLEIAQAKGMTEGEVLAKFNITAEDIDTLTLDKIGKLRAAAARIKWD